MSDGEGKGLPRLRRVITGINEDGRSCILFDGPAEPVIWSAPELPVDNSGTQDMGLGRFRFPTSGVDFNFANLPPGGEPFMHATNTIDFVVVVSGEIVFITETGEVALRAGDVLVDRGIVHAWRNDSDQTCRIVCVMCPAHPVGAGANFPDHIDL